MSYSDWMQSMEIASKKYERFGAFLPAQQLLLRQIYDSLTKRSEKVVSFTAPPASGKTHIITLCAYFLADKGFKTCIVTPNAELKQDFKNELLEVNGATKSCLPIESITTYRKRRSTFDYVLVDEAHDLRSAIELDTSIVKSFHLEEGDPLFDHVSMDIDKKTYNTKELNIETCTDILKEMSRTDGYPKAEAKFLLGRLSQWRAFEVVFGKSCDLKFLLADPKKRSLLPKGRLFIFSATRLEPEELEFYCNIPRNILRTVGERKTTFVPKPNVAYRYCACSGDEDKLSRITELLKTKSLPTLILMNNNSKCLLLSEEISKTFGNRLVLVPSGLKYQERVKAFDTFTNLQDGILLTSSNVYWEGITIKNLKLLIIPNIPFPQPTILELAERKATEYHKIANRRLIQGIGRIGRLPQDRGVCLLLFAPSSTFKYVKNSSIDDVKSFISDL